MAKFWETAPTHAHTHTHRWTILNLLAPPLRDIPPPHPLSPLSPSSRPQQSGLVWHQVWKQRSENISATREQSSVSRSRAGEKKKKRNRMMPDDNLHLFFI